MSTNSKLSTAIHLALGISTVTLAISVAPSVLAEENSILEEVIVTATKRAMSVRDVPYSISVVTGDVVQMMGFTDAADLSKIVPGLVVSDAGNRTGFISTNIIIRGMNISDSGFLVSPRKSVPTVAIYVNDTPLNTNLQLMDIERIEVLRGPQGTLYGSGSVGGNVRYILKKPDLNEISGEVIAEFSDTKSASGFNYNAQVILNLPISENFGLRFNASYNQEQGFMDHNGLYVREGNDRFNSSALPVLADPSDPVGSAAVITSVKDADDADARFLRVAALYENERFSANLTYFHQELNMDSLPVYHFTNADDDYTNNEVTLTPFESITDMASLEIEVDFGFATLTSSSSYSDADSQGLFDGNSLYTNFPFYNAYYGDSPRPIFINHSRLQSKDFTQEVRLASAGDGRVDWLVGAFYQDVKREGDNFDFYPGYTDYSNACFPVYGFGSPECGYGTLFGIYPNNGPLELTEANKDLAFLSSFQDKLVEKTIFGEITLHVTNAWQITGGIRYFDQKYNVADQGGLAFVPNGVHSAVENFDASDTLFKFNTSYGFGDHKVYATWSEGFRRGGANALGPGTPEEVATYAPDEVINFEIGIKGVLNNRFEYSLGYFDIDWNDIQIQTLCGSNLVVCVVTGGDATSKGLEAEFTALLSDNLQIRAGYAYTDATLDKPSPILGDGALGGASPGDRLPGTPKNAGSITGLYTTNLNNGWALDANATISYSGKRTTSIEASQVEILDSYTIVDASVAVSSNDWTLRLFAKNLLDENSRISQLSTRTYGSFAESIARRPRTIGLSLKYIF